MYSLRQAKLALGRPKLVLREFNRWWFRLTRGPYNSEGVDFFAEDWDNMLILDTARYDVSKEKFAEYDLPGALEFRISRGSATHEFLRANVQDRELHDTVYVTASPHYSKHDDVRGEFYDVINIWEFEDDDGPRAKPPDVTARYAREAAEEYPNKRLLVHFVQPHWPFLGPTGREYFAGIDVPWLDHVGKGETEGPEFTREDVWDAYLENYDVVLPHVRDLLDELRGKTVVTADHGQLIGEKQRPIPVTDYGHPPGIYVDELVKVPWLVHQNGPRRDVVAEPPVAEGRDSEYSEAAAEETLRELGYLT